MKGAGRQPGDDFRLSILDCRFEFVRGVADCPFFKSAFCNLESAIPSYTATTGSHCANVVTPCHWPQRPFLSGILRLRCNSKVTDSPGGTGTGNGTTKAVERSSW